MELTVDKVQTMAKRIRAARAAQNRAAIDKLVDDYASMGIQLHYELQLYGYRIMEAACCNNAQRLRELNDGLRALREVLIEWRLVAEELGVFLKKGGNNDA